MITRQRDERDVDDDDVDEPADRRRRGVADVRALEHDDTRSSSRIRGCSWPWPTSRATTVTAPRAQQAVGEAAGRRADVEGDAARSTSMPNASRAASSFSPAAADEPRRRAGDDDRVAGSDEARRLVGDRAVDEHPPGGDRRPAPRCGWSASPRRTSSASRRRRAAIQARSRRGDLAARRTCRAVAFFAGAFLADALLGRRLLGRRLLRRAPSSRRAPSWPAPSWPAPSSPAPSSPSPSSPAPSWPAPSRRRAGRVRRPALNRETIASSWSSRSSTRLASQPSCLATSACTISAICVAVSLPRSSSVWTVASVSERRTRPP